MPHADPPDNDREFVLWFASSYEANCQCGDCERLRGIVGIERGDSFDPEEHGYDVSEQSGDQDPACDVCGEGSASCSMRNNGVSCKDCWEEAPIGYCPSCEGFYTIDSPRAWHDSVNSGATAVCGECVDDGVVDMLTCEYCDESWPEGMVDHAEPRDGKTVCGECWAQYYTRCGDCEEWVFSDYIAYSTHIRVCETCLEQNWVGCDRCGEFTRLGEANSCSCPANGIWNYTWSPPETNFLVSSKGVPYSKNPKQLFFGIEIEVEPGPYEDDIGRYARRVSDNGILYCKRDASLDTGFEVVSHPFTFGWFNEKGDKILKQFSFLKESGFTSFHNSTCGMHVHMSQKAFSRMQVYKFTKLFYENPEFTVKVSERDPDLFSRWAGIRKEGENSGKVVLYKALNGNNGVGGTHVAVNVNTRSPTIEVRIFNGAIREWRIRKNIELLKAAYDFTRVNGHSDITTSRFMDFVAKDEATYPNLYKFLSDEFNI